MRVKNTECMIHKQTITIAIMPFREFWVISLYHFRGWIAMEIRKSLYINYKVFTVFSGMYGGRWMQTKII